MQNAGKPYFLWKIYGLDQCIQEIMYNFTDIHQVTLSVSLQFLVNSSLFKFPGGKQRPIISADILLLL